MNTVEVLENQIKTIEAILAAGVDHDSAIEYHKQLTHCIELYAQLTSASCSTVNGNVKVNRVIFPDSIWDEFERRISERLRVNPISTDKDGES